MTRNRGRAGVLGVVLCCLGLLLPATASAGKHPSSRLHTRAIALPGSTPSDLTALQPGAAGSVWVIGRTVWHVAGNGQILQTLPPSQPGDPSTATPTLDGGVSFFGPRIISPGSTTLEPPVLDHVSATGALSTLSLVPGLAELPFGFMVETSSGLWGTAWHPPQPGWEGKLVRIDPGSGVVSNYVLPFEPLTIQRAPGNNFWVSGITRTSPARHVVGLVTTAGATLKTISLPGPVGHDNLMVSAATPNLGVWVATAGLTAYVSPSGQLTTYRPPYGNAELPYGIAVGADGTGWLVAGHNTVGSRRGQVAQPLQLARLQSGRSRVIPFRVPGFGSFGILSGSLAYADGKLWAVGGSKSSQTLYALTVKAR